MEIREWLKKEIPNLYSDKEIEVDDVVQAISSYINKNQIKKKVSVVSRHDMSSLREVMDWLDINNCDIINIQYDKSDGFYNLFYLQNE